MQAFEPTRAAGLARLEAFTPRAGRDYAHRRNYDLGPEDRGNVSMLSPWIRVRAVSEAETVSAALDAHGHQAADKFVQEVCWRTYWKGWLQLRPAVWTDYQRRLAADLDRLGGEAGYRRAVAGETPIDTFNVWAHELVEHNYLHNHARMWFASIWCFTLKLPWTLGADFFLRHLLDGDPASNTLSWRWVAGLQTRGKTYAARPDNIVEYTDGRLGHRDRFAKPEGSVYEPGPLPKPRDLPELPPAASVAEMGATGLLLTDEDLTPAESGLDLDALSAIAALRPLEPYTKMGLAEPVLNFRRDAQTDALTRLGQRPASVQTRPFDDLDEVVRWAEAQKLGQIVMLEPAVGPWDPVVEALRDRLACATVDLVLIRRAWDEVLWPHATRGFFRFKKVLPDALDDLVAGSPI